ncbi:adenylate kinase [Kitasatospora xanthocidica]|uniref:adenylate kinase family protein n=1 Tax=Kitasatospora xanthocidica TaxID=83382 RepID=UPI001677A5D1|nr:nucleoside monophosphate kinase [Kitasatospora xanthocidica]GHF77591.1 adenylate kinase [Kitasatospora xanthocidica]
MRIVNVQPPAWWWETPGESLARALDVPRINFGDLIRDHLRQGTELGLRADEIMEAGGAPLDELRTAIVRDHLRREAPAAFLLDHHPVNVVQALALDELLHELGTPLDGVVRLRLPEHELERHVRSVADRRVCRGIPTHGHEPAAGTPAAEGACDVCGAGLHQRRDDEESTVRARFGTHEARTAPVTRYYAERGLLVTVDAVGTPDEIAARALAALRRRGGRVG